MLFDNKRWTMPEVPVHESKTIEVLKAARARIAQGWCNSGGSDKKGGVCIIVAISRQAGSILGDGPGAEALSYVHRAIQPPPKDSDPLAPIFDWFDPPREVYPIDYPIDWNEAPGRTQAEVIAAFDRAIEIARREAR